jgi:hypothetical protein
MSNGNARGTQSPTIPTPPVNPNSGTNSTANTPSNQTNSTTTVTVYCKLPNGFLIELGQRDDPDYVSVGLKGISHMRTAGAEWGITEGVARDVWERFKKEKKDFKIIKGGFIFAQDDAKDAAAQGKAMAELRTGLEKLKPKNLPVGMKDVERKVERYVGA